MASSHTDGVGHQGELVDLFATPPPVSQTAAQILHTPLLVVNSPNRSPKDTVATLQKKNMDLEEHNQELGFNLCHLLHTIEQLNTTITELNNIITQLQANMQLQHLVHQPYPQAVVSMAEWSWD